jgi:uncharacterized protein (PEP-CTERM system associated)
MVTGVALWWTAPAFAQTAAATTDQAAPEELLSRPLATGSSLQRTLRNAATLQNGVPAEGGPAGVLGWQFGAHGGLDLTYTDNVLLTRDHPISDFIVTPRAGFALRDTTMRTAILANADVAYDYYTNTHRLNGVRPKAALIGVSDIAEEELSVEGRLSTDVQQISPEGRLPATERSIGENQTQVMNFGGRATWREHLSDVVQSEVFYDYGSVHFLGAPSGQAIVPASDTQQHLGEALLSNGTDFTRFGWSILGAYQELDPSGQITEFNPRQRTWHAEGSGQYRVITSLALTARSGYDWFRGQTFTRNLEGPFALGGFIWRPGPRLGVRVEAGYRYRGFNADAQIDYQLARWMSLGFTYLRDVQNSQSLIITNLANIGRDPFNNNPTTAPSVDPVTGLSNDLSGLTVDDPNSPFNPNRSVLGYANVTFKRDLAQGSVGGKLGRNFYQVTGSYERRSASVGASHDVTVQASVGRDLTPRLTAILQGSFEEVGGTAGVLTAINFASRTKSAEARADYRLGRTVTTSLRLVHAWRATTLVAYTENAGVLSLVKRF